VQVLAGWWDVYSHLPFWGVDPWWNPAHLTLYACVAITILVVWSGLRISSTLTPPLVSPIKFVNLAGLKLTGAGCIIEIIAAIWNEISYHVFHSEPRIASADALLTVGMLTVNLGIVVGLTVEYGMIKRGFIVVTKVRRWLTVVSVLLTFSAIWLAASGAFIYVGEAHSSFLLLNWTAAALIALTGTLVLVCAKKAMPTLGTIIVIGGVFNLVVYFFLVIYVGAEPYLPWALLPVILFDVIATELVRILGFAGATFVSSLAFGLLFWVAYFPFTTYLFPWSSSAQLPTVFVVVGAVAGGWLGNRLFAGLSSLVLGDAASV
jgi:hypothetical protein